MYLTWESLESGRWKMESEGIFFSVTINNEEEKKVYRLVNQKVVG